MSRAGREHYAEAEQLIEAVTALHPHNPARRILREDADPLLIYLAQVHATLALADQVQLVPRALGALP